MTSTTKTARRRSARPEFAIPTIAQAITFFLGPMLSGATSEDVLRNLAALWSIEDVAERQRELTMAIRSLSYDGWAFAAAGPCVLWRANDPVAAVRFEEPGAESIRDAIWVVCDRRARTVDQWKPVRGNARVFA